jgi:hypothetical protein
MRVSVIGTTFIQLRSKNQEGLPEPSRGVTLVKTDHTCLPAKYWSVGSDKM